MANGLYGFQSQIEITDNNKWLDYGLFPFYAEVSVSIATGVYDNMKDVLTALDTALTVATVSLSSSGVVSLYRSLGFWQIFWKTGTHGSDNADNHIGTVLGFDDSADSGTGYTKASDYQHQCGWYPGVLPFADYGDRPVLIGGQPHSSWGGHVRRITNGTTQHTRNIEWGLLPRAKVLRKHASTNESLESFWSYIARGRAFDIFVDTDLIMSESPIGTYSLVTPVSDLSPATLARAGIQSEYYSFTMDMIKDES